MSISVTTLIDRIEQFFSACEKTVENAPEVVVIAMHELARNIYPSDPYIPLSQGKHRLDALDELIGHLTLFVKSAAVLGSYRKLNYPTPGEIDVRDKTGNIYGKLWNLYPDEIISEAVAIIEERFKINNLSLDLIRDKKVLDAGCGSGRYSIAMSKLGAAKVVGIDYGDQGLALANSLADKANIRNVEFCKGDLRHIPFNNNSFDFVFSNGTAHHTGDIPACVSEIYRILKHDGGEAWFYLYGAGGVFWYTRRKMNEFMPAIPQDYALKVLDLIGMPMNRFIFADNWYVPIEEHTLAQDFESLLNTIGFQSFRRLTGGRSTDLDYLAIYGSDKDREMWGDGELRYIVSK